MRSITRKIKESHIWIRRGAFVTKRPDDASRVRALPPPSRKNKKEKVTEKKTQIIEKKQIDDDDEDDESILDEKRLEREKEISTTSKKPRNKIVRRGLGEWDEKDGNISRVYHKRRQVTKSVSEFEVKSNEKMGWWTKCLTTCMPSDVKDPRR